MYTIGAAAKNESVAAALRFGFHETPIYVEGPDGALHEVDGMRTALIQTPDGAHGVLVVQASDKTATEIP